MANDDDSKTEPVVDSTGMVIGYTTTLRMQEPAPEPAPVAKKLAWEEWAAKLGVPHWKADAARHGRAWPLGQEVTEDEFNQAVYDAFNSRIG